MSEDQKMVQTIGTLGPEGTFSSIAATHFIDQLEQSDIPVQSTLFPSISAVFTALKEGEIMLAMVPQKNSIGGQVEETIQNLEQGTFGTMTAFSLEIAFALVSSVKSQKNEEIKKIYSHPQALKQCYKFLQATYPKAELHETASTIDGLRKAKKSDSAAIIPLQTAQDLQKKSKKGELTILAENIQDEDQQNITTFIVVTAS